MNRCRFIIAAAAAVLAGWPAATVLAADPDHVKAVQDWQATREANLRKPDGWLSFIGSGRVARGASGIGTDPDHDIVLPIGPASLGVLTLDADDSVSLTVAADSDAVIDGEPFERVTLKTQRDEGGPTHVHLGEAWFYIVRLGDGSTGWRLRDPQSPAIRRFAGIERFPIDEQWRIQARWQVFDPPRTMELPTSAGSVDTGTVPGQAEFELDGAVYTLQPIVEDDGPLFFVFADRTSGRETYGAARFLYADPPVDGIVELDFNKAYNPPCALTPHVVCPLAPPENRLDLRVTAGEKRPQADLHDP